jgi:hypothetical protein
MNWGIYIRGGTSLAPRDDNEADMFVEKGKNGRGKDLSVGEAVRKSQRAA